MCLSAGPLLVPLSRCPVSCAGGASELLERPRKSAMAESLAHNSAFERSSGSGEQASRLRGPSGRRQHQPHWVWRQELPGVLPRCRLETTWPSGSGQRLKHLGVAIFQQYLIKTGSFRRLCMHARNQPLWILGSTCCTSGCSPSWWCSRARNSDVLEGWHQRRGWGHRVQRAALG